MTELLIAAFLFFLPAGIANMFPVLAARTPLLRKWNSPLDFGKTFRGKRIFGANKTWRGLITGTLAGGLTGVLLQSFIHKYGITAIGLSFVTGSLMGFGALLGDAVESFIKRQKGIDPGASWFPFDQIDYIIGGLIFVYPVTFTLLLPALVVTIMVIYFGLHIMTSYIGYRVGLKTRPI